MGVLESKVVIVTGAGGGIGAEVAKYAAREGARVVVNDLGCGLDGHGQNSSLAEQVADEIRKTGGTAVADTNSVATWGSAHSLVQTALDAFGRIDGIVNNAGVVRDCLFHKMDEDQWDTVEQVNLDGVFYVSRAAAPHFRKQQSGAYVHMTSTSGLIGNYGQVNYGASKMGVVGLSKCIALDMKRFGVRSNAVAPFAFTRIVSQMKSDTDENRKRLEVLKTLSADKIAPFTAALLSDRASQVSGQIFGVRRDEIMLFSQPRPIRTIHAGEGWTAETCLEQAIPYLSSSFYPVEISSEAINWDPI